MANSAEIVQIEEIDKGLKSLNSTLTTTADNYLKLVKTINEGSATININVASTASLAAAQRQTAANTQQLDALGKQLQASEQRLKDTEDARLKTILENRLATQAATRALQDQIKAEQAEEGSLVRMRQKLAELTKAYDQAGTRTAAAASEINNLSREILQAEEATNRHQRNVGNYGEAIGALSSPLGNAISSVQSFGRSLWTLVANPVGAFIAAIVASLALLYKAWTSTDEGAVKMEGTLKAIGNVMDVLIDRAMNYYKMLWSLVTFDWDGVKKNGKAAFGGLKDAVMSATDAGWNYAKVMDDINDREAAAQIRMANLAVEVETLKNKAYTETGKTKLNTLQQAMDKEIELNGIEKGFLTEKNNAEISNLASKIQNNKLTQAQKEEELKQWLSIDDRELQSAMEKNEAFAEFENKNEADFQKLQKSKSEESNKDRELQTETRRLQKGLATEKEDLQKKDIENAKKAREKIIENAETANKQEIQLINKSHIEGKTSDDQYKTELINNEIKFLNKKATLYKAGSKEYEDIQLQIQAITIKSQDDINKSFEDSIKVFENGEDDKQKLIDDTLKAKIDADIASVDSSVKTLDEIKKEEKKAAEDKIKLAEKIADKQHEIESEFVNGIFDLQSSKRDEELDALEKEKTAKLSNKKLTEAQKAKIEEEYDKKAAAIKTKQAKADKLQAMFNIALNTAIGSMKAVAESPLTGGMPFLAWVIAAGALQLALAAAQPIPKYKYGTDSAEDRGIFGEAGRELMIPRSGEMILANKATYFEGSKFKGAKIFSNPETEKMIGLTEHSVGGRQMTDERLLNEMILTRKAIQNKPVNIINSDYKVIGQGTSRHQDIYLSRLTRNN